MDNEMASGETTLSLEERLNIRSKDEMKIRVEIWPWYGEPVHSSKNIFGQKTIDRIHKEIQTAPLSIALTSPSEYIRCYRKWYEEHKSN